jgi:outer membrane protein, heavy metal efflux system
LLLDFVNLLSRRLCLTLFLFTALPTTVLAQNAPRNLRIEEAIQRAESNNPQLLVARRNIAAAEAGAVIAIATPNPRIALDAPIGLAETKRTVSIEQPFELGGKREARLNLASDQIQAAQLQLEILRWQIRSDVRQAYAELAIAKSARRQGEQTVVLAQQLVEIARKRLAAGDVAEADLIQVRFVLERARQRLEPTANRIRQATIRLDNLLGEPTDDAIQPTDQKVFSLSVEADRIAPEAPPPIPELTVLRTLAQKRRIDLSLAVLQQRIGDDQLKLARSNQIPDISFATGFTWDPVAATTAALLGLRIDLPIFNPRQGEVNQALANRSLAEAQRLVLERQVEREVTAAYENVRSAERLLKQDRNILLPQSEQVLELARKSYQFGQTGLSDVLIAQQSVQDQRDAYYNDVLAYQTALGSLERAVNQPLTSNPDVPTTP